MNHEHATADGASTERDGERTSSEPPTGVGITDDDMAQIRSFLQKQRHRRSVDDLRPSEP